MFLSPKVKTLGGYRTARHSQEAIESELSVRARREERYARRAIIK
jgi:hypothetical protein